MNVFEVKTVRRSYLDGKVKHRTIKTDVAFPSTADEITFKMWDKYFQMKENDPDWMKEIEKLKPHAQLEEQGKWDKKRWAEYYSRVVHYLSCFTDANVEDIAGANLSGEAGDGILSIYFSIIGIINSYEAVAVEYFEYKGDTYVIDKIDVDRFGKTHYGKNLKANQIIDALQYEHVFNVKGNDGKFLVADKKYQIDIALMAVLSRKVLPDGSLDERPLDFIERQEWTDAKIQHFKDAPMTIALNVDFFLRNLKRNSLNTLIREAFSKTGKLLQTQKP